VKLKVVKLDRLQEKLLAVSTVAWKVGSMVAK
jgi:hypothetical protein